MYDQYLADPSSVSESWREFFDDYKPASTTTSAPSAAAPAAPAPATPAPATPAPAAPAPSPPTSAPSAGDGDGQPLRGAAARIVTNMEASLGVPTATSFREVPAKLIEVNRRILNNHLARTRGGKVSFTHIIGFAVVRAIAEQVPNMNNTFATGADGKPRVVRNEH